MKVETLSQTRRAASAPLRRKLIAVLVAACYTAAEASPVSPTVVAGQASFNLQGKTYSITNTPNTIINWQSFSVASDEITRFIQQSADSKVLNRITGQDPTQILGSLQSNGKVFLINPNGVMFGAGSRVDVNGLVASSLAISNADFLSGKNNFTDVANAGKVSNAGTITTPAGGQIFLVAPAVENSGIISSANGDVVLAAGHSVQLFDSKDPNVQVVVSSPSDQAVNLGQIVAQGGRVGVYGALVSQRGAINANSAVRGENGRIVLKSSGTTMVEAGSTTTAVGSNLNTGGDIQLLGDKVGLTGNAVVDASGAAGGGTVLVGGDYQGKNAAVKNAQQSYVGKDAVIKADATGLGDGGKIIVWSDEATRVYGSIYARGGANGGNGGFVETSGHYLDMQGAVDTRAPQGSTGKLLLDPSNVYIANSVSTATAAGMEGNNEVPSTGSTVFLETGYWVDSLLTTANLQNALATTDVTVSTVNNITRGGVGFIKVLSPVSWSSSHSLTLEATTDINLNAAINAPNAALNLHANGGLITQVTSPIDGLTASSINAIAASSISLDNTGNSVSGQIALQTTSGNATVTAQSLSLGAVNVGGALVASGVNSLTTNSAITAGGDITLTADQMTLGAAVNGSTGHTVTLQPYSNSTNVALGGSAADATGTLGLSQAELQNIGVGGGTLAIGAFDSAHTGNVAVTGNLDLTSTLASGTLLLEAQSGSIAISQPLTLAGGLTLQTTNNISAPASVSVGGTFTLADGSWAQLGTLPAFSAHDFRIGSGTFLRASGGDGSLTAPYLLEDAYGLQGVGSLLMLASYKLNTNIDASGTANWNGGQGFKPIGGLDYAYTGTFDGNNLAINGLHINRGASDNIGLFSYLGTGTIKNLSLNSGIVTGRNNVGGVYGSSQTGGLVQNVHSDVDVTGVFNVGGMAGTNYASISDSSASGTVNGIAGGDASNIGGLVGRNLGSISYSSASGDVNATGFGYAGGLVGSNAADGSHTGSIDHAFATGDVYSTGEIIGGLVGDNNGGGISVAYSTGAVNGGRNVGGFAGRNTNNGTITNVYTSSNVSGNTLDSSYSHANMGGLLGDLNSGTVSNSFSNGSVTGTAFSGANVYGMVGSHESGNLVHGYFDSTKAGTASDIAGTALTTAQTMKAASFAGFDVSGQGHDQSSSVWRIYDGLTVPMLRDYLTPTTVAVTGGTSVTKVYDGTGAAFGGALVNSLPAGVDGSLAFDGPFNVGDHSVGGLYSSKYDISYTGSSALLHVTPAPLSLSLLSREYNGTTAGTVTGATLVGVVHVGDDYDNVSLVAGNATATYADKNVGVGKTVTLGGTGLALSGADAGNYTVPVSATGTITARPLSTFNAVGGGLWSAAGNWVDGIAPDGANVLAAAIQSGSGTITYDASAGNTTLANFSVGSGRNLELTGGALTVTGTGGKSYASGATLTLNGGSLVLNGSLDGTYLTLTSGTISGTSSSANLYVNNLTQTGGSIDMSGSLNVINGNSIAIGSVRAQSGITLNAGEGGTITQTGPLVTDSLHAMATNGITLTNTGNHVGAFTATNYSGDIRLNNTVSSGELALGPLSTTGNIIIDNHGGIHTTGTIHAIHSGANTGLVSIAAHSPITVNDTIDGSDIGLSASTSITLAPGTSLQSTNTIGLTAGTGIAMDSSSVVNSGSSIALTAGTGIVLGGSLSVASGGSISATAASGSITASSGTSINSSGGTIILAAPQGSVTTPNVTFTGVQPTVTDGAAAAAAAAQAAAAAAAAQAAADAAAKAAADAAAKAAADAAAAAAAQAAADAAAKAAADAAAKAAADAAAKAAADAAAAQAAADAAKAAADAAAKAAADAAAKAAADAAAKAAADAAAQAAADAAAKAASDAAAKAAADAAAKAAADAAAAAAAAGSGTPTPVGQALNSTVNIINTVTTTVQANKNTPATVPTAPDTTVASTGSGSGGNSKPDDKVPDSKATDKKDDSGTTAVAKNEPTKKMYCN
ncbi:beta strand repeat-containing protein [Duganella sp. LjRoot269]|uniref:beta strand repeat-containing protein n=1 Tax=Duganella sp. LjRoot269 TaxID=3342305 RepID=UPI003ED0DB3B